MTIYRGVGGTGDSATGEDVFGPNSSITSLDGITGGIEDPTYVRFAADNGGHIPLQGDLTWNTSEGTLDLGLNGGDVILQIGQEIHYRVTNQSGVNLPNGSLLAFAGTTGNSGKLLVELYDGTQPSKFIVGIATETIANGANGYVTHFGKVRGIQTNGANYSETWIDGDELYPASGGLTNILPEAPNAKQPVAVVVNSHVSNGELFVRVQGHTALEDDEMVQLTSLTDGDVLQYDAAQTRFENRSLSTAGIQPTLVSGTNIKTINSESLLGSTDIVVTTATDIANMLETTDIGVSVQGYDIDTAKYDDVTSNFTGALQNGGSNVVVDTDIGSTVLAYDSNLQSFVSTFTLPTADSTNGFVLQTNGSGTLSFSAGGGGLADGDKGDITVSSGGTVWSVDNDAITYAKIQNVSATDKLLGRVSVGAGDIEEITCTQAGRDLLDDVNAAAQRTTLGLGTIATQAANNVAITGGSITGITDLAIADGGTGASTAAQAFTNLKQNATETVTGVVELATSAEASAGTSDAVVITPLKLRNGLNATGTAPIYACRAWVNFNGTGSVAIRASGNVSSITDNGTGDYTVNFTTAIADANYAVALSAVRNASNSDFSAQVKFGGTYTAAAVQVTTGAQSVISIEDAPVVNVMIFR